MSNTIWDVGEYDNASEYVRDLIRHDMQKKEQLVFEALKAELQKAFTVPDSEYIELSANDIISRNN